MAASIEPVQLSDASEQYQFLADESMRKLMVAHRVTSPMLMGIKDNTGLGNNADELKTASLAIPQHGHPTFPRVNLGCY